MNTKGCYEKNRSTPILPTTDQSTASLQDDHSICAHLMVLNLVYDHYDMYLLHLS